MVDASACSPKVVEVDGDETLQDGRAYLVISKTRIEDYAEKRSVATVIVVCRCVKRRVLGLE